MKRAILGVLVGSVVLNAALGIYALVGAEFGDVQRRILFTSLCVSGAGLLSLACAPAFEGRRVRPLPQIGMAAAVVGFALLIAVVWQESPPDALSKTAVTFIIAATCAALGSLLALARLPARFRWVLGTAVGLSVVLAGLFVSLVWGEWDSEAFARALGVVAVLLAAFTVLVPILHRATRAERAPVAPRPAHAPVRFCPLCGEQLAAEHGTETVCPRCGGRFTVVFTSARVA